VALHHIATRANDRKLVIPLCERCHGIVTDWQWALGILRREPIDLRGGHGDSERAWAGIEGLVLISLVGGPIEPQRAFAALGRAAGVYYKLRDEAVGLRAPWGPRPARGRVARDHQRWDGAVGDGVAALQAALEFGSEHLAGEPRFAALRARIEELVRRAEDPRELPGVADAVAMLRATLEAIAGAATVADLGANWAAREVTLSAIEEVLNVG